MTLTDVPPLADFVHPALFYGSDDEYLDLLLPFITDGLAQGHPVAAAVPGGRLRVLRAGLGDAAGDVLLIDMEAAGRNPGRIIPTVLRRFADAHPHGHVRIIGEPIWAGRSTTEYPACAQHEALINHAFAGRDVTIACPYDTTALDPQVVADARATHPVIWETGGRYPSDQFAPNAVIARYNQPLDPAEDAAEIGVAEAGRIREARRFAAQHAHRLGLPAERASDLEVIATELVTNSLLHARSECLLRIWSDGEHLVCEVRDNGHLTDLLAGRRPPHPDCPSGRGLLMVNQLADLVRTHSTSQGTRLYALLRLG